MKWFVIDGQSEMVCQSGMDGIDHNGGIFAKSCHSGMIYCLHLSWEHVCTSLGYNNTMVCHG